MRRTIAAVVVTLVVGVTAIAGPVATASAAPAQDPQGPIPQIACGTLGNPVCELIDQLEAVLAPLAPLLAVTGPLLGELGNALHSLGTLTEQLPDKPADEVLEVVRAALGQLGKVTKPVLGLLGLGNVDALTGILTQLDAALVDQLSAPTAGAVDAPAAAAAAPGSAAVPASSLSTGRSFSSTSPGPAPTTTPTAPTGEALALGPLALPDFGTTGLLAAPLASTDTDVLPLLPVVAGEDEAAAGPAVAAAAALSGILLAVGLILRARQQELPELT